MLDYMMVLQPSHEFRRSCCEENDGEAGHSGRVVRGSQRQIADTMLETA